MNPFVKLNKRDIQLPMGCKDLADVLRAKCEYCGAPAEALHFMGMEDYRWCAECQRDLKEFAAKEDYKFDFDTNDEAAVSRFRSELDRRQDEFMNQRVRERKPQ